MAFTIRNRAKHLLIIPLNSGESLYLAPGESSGPVESYELDNNAKVEKMLRDNLISSAEADAQAASAAAGAQPNVESNSALNTTAGPSASDARPGEPPPAPDQGGKVKQK